MDVPRVEPLGKWGGHLHLHTAMKKWSQTRKEINPIESTVMKFQISVARYRRLDKIKELENN